MRTILFIWICVMCDACSGSIVFAQDDARRAALAGRLDSHPRTHHYQVVSQAAYPPLRLRCTRFLINGIAVGECGSSSTMRWRWCVSNATWSSSSASVSSGWRMDGHRIRTRRNCRAALAARPPAVTKSGPGFRWIRWPPPNGGVWNAGIYSCCCTVCAREGKVDHGLRWRPSPKSELLVRMMEEMYPTFKEEFSQLIDAAFKADPLYAYGLAGLLLLLLLTFLGGRGTVPLAIAT